MNQELLQNICKTIIESEQATTVETLNKMISDNQEIITDKKIFYVFLLNCIADNLHFDENEDVFEADTLNSLGFEKLKLFKILISLHPEIGGEFNPILIKLGLYNSKEVNAVILELADIKEAAYTKRYLSNNIKDVSENYDLVKEIIRFGAFSPNDPQVISLHIAKVNVELYKLIEFERSRTPEGRITDETYHSEAVRTRENKIRDLTSKRDSMISLINDIIQAKGIENFSITESFIEELLRSEKIGYNIMCDHCNSAIINKIAESEKTLKSLSLPKLIDQLVSNGFAHYSIRFLPKMSEQQLMESERINYAIQVMLSKMDQPQNVEKYKEYLQKISESDILYRLYPHTILTLLEFLHSDKAEKGFDDTLRFEINEEQQMSLSVKVNEIIKKSARKQNKPEGFYERFIIELLQKYHYDDSIIHILQNHELDMDYNPVTYRGPQELDYWICSEGSDEVKKAFVSRSNLPLYVSSEADCIDVVSVCLSVKEYSKAKELFDNHNFAWVDEEQEKALLENGTYEIGYPYYMYFRDEVGEAINGLQSDISENPEAGNLLRHIISSPKTKFINVQTLSTIWDQETLGIINKRYCDGELTITYADFDQYDCDEDHIVRLATEEEIKEAWCDDLPPMVKKMMPIKQPKNESAE